MIEVNFRYHRGSFKESMETKISNGFVALILNILKVEYETNNVKIEYQTFDSRLKADSYIVTANGNAIGHLWYSEIK